MAVNANNKPKGASANNTSGRNFTIKRNKSARTNNMDDGGASAKIANSKMTVKKAKNISGSSFKSLMHYNNLFTRDEIDIFNKTYRFGLFNPYGAVTHTREVLFFTKPDLNIYLRDDDTGIVDKTALNPGLASIPFWKDLLASRPKIINTLQLSANPKDNFNHLLQNQVISNLDIPGLTAETIDTAVNMYGVGFTYRGSSEASDDSFDFSLEFKDSRWLDTYYFFKAYENYETLKHHGVIRPWKRYIERKEIHDQFSIYKFLLDEDMETILYWGKFYGVFPKSLPRDVFSNATFDNGISYSIEFKAAFFEDMAPEILADFNKISYRNFNSQKYEVDVYNTTFGRVDNRPVKAAYIEKVKSTISPTGYVMKLRWKGSDKL